MTIPTPAHAPLVNTQRYDRISRSYRSITIYAGDQATLGDLYPGITLRLDDGREGVVQSRYTRYSLVRFNDTGLAEKVATTTLVTPLERVPGWGLPGVGTFVEVLVGEHTGRLGVITNPGVNSTHVVFPDGVRFAKFAAKNLKVVKAEITLV